MKTKFLILFMSFLMVFSLAGCSKKDKDIQQDTVVDEYTDINGNEYYDIYTRNYNASLAPLQESYGMYGDMGLIEEYYKTNDYPGNHQYLQDVRAALVDSRDKVEEFVNNMEKDAKSDVAEIREMNEDLLEDGRDLVEDIDEKIKKLDNIAETELNKSEAEFRKLIGDTIEIEEDGVHDFKEMIKNLEKKVDEQKKGNTNTNSK